MSDVTALHHALVDMLTQRGHIRSARVEAAFRAVQRHVFLPGVPLDEVYRDQVFVTKRIDGVAVSSSSQPQIMAIMLEQLGLLPGHRVLEIGAGTGYNAALMAHIVGDTGGVISVDIDEDIVEDARAHLAAAGVERVQVIAADGGFGHPAAAPYDRIILTVGAWDVAPAWPDQLRPGGRLVLPLTVGGTQKAVAFEHDAGHLLSVSVKECLFMPLRGSFASPGRRVVLRPRPGLNLWVGDRADVDAEATYALLSGPSVDVSAFTRVTAREVYGGVVPWVALHEPGFCWLEAEGAAIDASPVPRLFGAPGGVCSTAGVLDGRGACFLMRPPGEPLPALEEGDPPRFELFVRGVGDDGPTRRVLDRIAAWEARGRPGADGLRIRAFPIGVAHDPSPGEIVVPKRWTRLVLDWPAQPDARASGSR